MTNDRHYVPTDRHYDAARHSWAHRDQATGRVRVGIDAIGLDSLGELAYIALKEPGTRVARGETIGSLEAAKMTTTITVPVGGTIVARNEDVLTDASAVNRDPYGQGWLVELEPNQWETDAATLISGDAITPWVTSELERLRAEDQNG